MGRGRRFFRWLRKKLAIRRKKKSRKNKKNKKDGVKRSPSQESLAQHHQDTGSGNSRSEGVCADTAVQQGGDTSPPEPDTPKPQQEDDVSIHQIETQPLPLLPPSEVECEKTASPQPPKLELTTTKLGNTAFQVVGEQGVASKAPEKFQCTCRVFDDEFLRKKEERRDKACQRRRQLLEAIKEKQRVREEERAAARMRKITGNVPSYDDLEVAQQDTERDSEEGNVAEEESEAVVAEVAEEGNVLEDKDDDDDAPEVVVVEEDEVAEVEEVEKEEEEEECVAVSEIEPQVECKCSTSTRDVASFDDVEQTDVSFLLWSEDTLQSFGFGDDAEFLTETSSLLIAMKAYKGMMAARQKQREASIKSWMEFYMPSGSNDTPDTRPEEGSDIVAEEAHGENATEEAHSKNATEEAHSVNAAEETHIEEAPDENAAEETHGEEVPNENAAEETHVEEAPNENATEEACSENDSVDAQVEVEQSCTSTYDDRKQVSVYPAGGVLEDQVTLPHESEYLLEMQRACAVKEQILIAQHGIKIARLMQKRQASVESLHSRSSAPAPDKSARPHRSHSSSSKSCTRASEDKRGVRSLEKHHRRPSSSFASGGHFPAKHERSAERFAHAHNTRPVCYPEKVVAERRRYLYKMRLWRKARKSFVVSVISRSSADYESSGEEADDEREDNFSSRSSRSKVVQSRKTKKRSAAPLKKASSRASNRTASKMQTVSSQPKVEPVIRRKPKPVRIRPMPWPEDSNAFFVNSSKPMNKSGSSNTLKSSIRSLDEGYSSHLKSFPPCPSKQRSSGHHHHHHHHPPRHHHKRKTRLASIQATADDMPCICENGNILSRSRKDVESHL